MKTRASKLRLQVIQKGMESYKKSVAYYCLFSHILPDYVASGKTCSLMDTQLEIIHLDSLGQGVAKLDGQIFFIPKTLPNEVIYTNILNKSKGVNFCSSPTKIITPSKKRTPSQCIHYDKCNGCHYLHTDYETEWNLKLESFNRAIFKSLSSQVIERHAAPQRFAYRNRIQLHYSKKSNEIGFIGTDKSKIQPIPNCQIAQDKIKEELQKIYSDIKTYLKKAKKSKGHVELMVDEQGKLIVNFDKHYSYNGFRQVFNQMNLDLKKQLKKLNTSNETIIDLFGGNGNLSEGLDYKKRYIIDSFTEKGDEFFTVDLYSKEAIPSLEKIISQNNISCDTLLIDPPRSGLKNIEEFINLIKPTKIAYVSCNWQTQIRDLKKIEKDYTIKSVEVFDFFPGTYHFETLLTLQKN